MLKTLLIVIALVCAPAVALADHDMAELALQGAVGHCYDLVYNPTGTDAKQAQDAYQYYKDSLDRALKRDPNILKTPTTFTWLKGSDNSDPKLKKRTLGEWVAFCNDSFPKWIAERTAKQEIATKRDLERKKEEAQARDAETKHQNDRATWDAAYSAKLKGDRKRLWKDRGWPESTSVDDDSPYDTEAAYAKVVTAKWWRYRSMENRRGEMLCTETFYFSGNKRTKRTAEGICH